MSGVRKILLIDDDTFVMHATADLLRDAGYVVYTCDSWTDLLQTVRASKPSLILLDYNMPLVKGDDICKALKRNLPDNSAKIALFSSEEADLLATLARDCGADGYLSKSCGRQHIVDGVSLLLS